MFSSNKRPFWLTPWASPLATVMIGHNTKRFLDIPLLQESCFWFCCELKTSEDCSARLLTLTSNLLLYLCIRQNWRTAGSKHILYRLQNVYKTVWSLAWCDWSWQNVSQHLIPFTLSPILWCSQWNWSVWCDQFRSYIKTLGLHVRRYINIWIFLEELILYIMFVYIRWC